MSEDINVTDGTVLEALNNKVDLDGGNYVGSPLEEYIHDHCGGGLEIGDIGIAPLGIDETKGKRRYLNGQLIIQEQYVQFTNKVKSAITLYPSLACTESEWQATALLTVGGQVGKFVVDDDAGTIRLPKIIMPIQGLTDLSKLGEIVEAGLPNITGTLVSWNDVGTFSRSQVGAFANDTSGNTNRWPSSGTSSDCTRRVSFNASRSSAIYGNSNTVQQEQIQYPYFIQVATGAETEDNIINEIELNNPYSFGDSKYSPIALNNLSWLKSEGQYNSKAVYPAYYDWALTNFNNGVEGFALSTGEYTDYDVVINPADETFRLPLLDGSENIVDYNKKLSIDLSTDTVLTQDVYVLVSSINTKSAYVYVNGMEIQGQICNASSYAQKTIYKLNRGDTVRATGSVVVVFACKGNGSLYFYVGETVQNANLVNIGRIQENMVTRPMVDGQWVASYSHLSSTTAIGEYTIDLSDYLPNDGYIYEILITYRQASTGSSACYANLGTDIIPNIYVGCTSTVSVDNLNSFSIAVGTQRILIKKISGATASASDIEVLAYRRLGTNV